MSFVSRRRVKASSLAAGGSLLIAGASRLPQARAYDAAPDAGHTDHADGNSLNHEELGMMQVVEVV